MMSEHLRGRTSGDTAGEAAPVGYPGVARRPKVKFLLVIWGKRYIDDWVGISLPSLLAPGNLPALAQSTDLEILIMTAAADVRAFEKSRAFQRLAALCPVRFIDISDLIVGGVYGVTLTLAFARAVMLAGADMVNIHFVFMNADFVLADGSLRTLARHILAGRAIVVAPSLRVVAERVAPILWRAIDRDTQTLVLAPRTMVGVALRYLHRMTVAKTMTQPFCSTRHPNQLFWQVGEHTVLGRYFLIFMLCLRPERVVTKINSYCDYGFIPEMCPSGDESALTDSDEFLALELQRDRQEAELIRLGSASMRSLASSLAEWTTAEHRRAARYDVVFHARELPPDLEAAKQRASRFIAELADRMSPPVPHAHHHYWVGGLDAWRELQHCSTGEAPWPPEAEWRHPFIGLLWRYLKARNLRVARWIVLRALRGMAARSARRWIVLRALRGMAARSARGWKALACGVPPFVRWWRHDWTDYLPIQAYLTRALRENGKLLFVSDGFSGLRDRLAREPRIVAAVYDTLKEMLAAGPFDHCLCYVLRKDVRRTRRLIEAILPRMTPGAEVLVFIHHLDGEAENTNFSYEIVDYVSDILPAHIETLVDVSVTGGRIKRLLRRLERRALGTGARHRWLLPLALPAWALLQGLTLANNLRLRAVRRDERSVQYCSSVVLRYRAAIGAPQTEQVAVATASAEAAHAALPCSYPAPRQIRS